MEWIILLLVIVGVVAFIVGIYNRLVAARNAYKNAFAQIDVQLTRRYDLIPNLVEIAKGYLKHERETLEAVIKARNAEVDGLKGAAADPAKLHQLEKAFTDAQEALMTAYARMIASGTRRPDMGKFNTARWVEAP